MTLKYESSVPSRMPRLRRGSSLQVAVQLQVTALNVNDNDKLFQNRYNTI